MDRSAWRLLAVAAQVGALTSCTPPNMTGPALKPTSAAEAFGAASCNVAHPPTEPDLMAWDPGARASLAGVRRQGVAVVRYEANGCDVRLELLNNCVAVGQYQFVPYWESDSKVARNANELYAKLPVGAADLAAKMHGNHAIRADYMMAGIAQIQIGTPYQARDLMGDCARATHVVSKMYLGAFAMAEGESRTLMAAASVFVQMGGNAEASMEHLQHAGDAKACESSRQTQTENSACAVPLRLTLLSLAQARACIDPSECEGRCNGGEPASCTILGGMYRQGNGVVRDPTRAAGLFKQACDRAEWGGCGNLGGMYLDGDGVPADPVRASMLLGQACNGGVSFGCGLLGMMYENGTTGAVDIARARTLYGQACEWDDDEACKKAAELREKACDAGEAHACYELGGMVGQGRGVAKDMARALSIFEEACRKNDSDSCVEAGGLYLAGPEIPKNPARALALFKQVCDRGEAIGCSALGTLYFTGVGVGKNLPRAVALFDRACDGGDPKGCAYLGSAYEEGKGVRIDLARALALYKDSCDAGAPIGCADLGSLYEEGKGVQADLARAQSLYNRACRGGMEEACRAIERLMSTR